MTAPLRHIGPQFGAPVRTYSDWLIERLIAEFERKAGLALTTGQYQDLFDLVQEFGDVMADEGREFERKHWEEGE